MIKTLRNLTAQDKDSFTVPQSVQDAIPIRAIYEDGIFALSGGRRSSGIAHGAGQWIASILPSTRSGQRVQRHAAFYSKTFRFDDINYAVASKEDNSHAERTPIRRTVSGFNAP